MNTVVGNQLLVSPSAGSAIPFGNCLIVVVLHINGHNEMLAWFGWDILQVWSVKLRFQVLIFPGHYSQFSLSFLQQLSSTQSYGIGVSCNDTCKNILWNISPKCWIYIKPRTTWRWGPKESDKYQWQNHNLFLQLMANNFQPLFLKNKCYDLKGSCEKFQDGHPRGPEEWGLASRFFPIGT